MPTVGFGTWPLKGDECSRLVAEAIEAGYRHIDTAQGYGNEAAVGRGLRDAGNAREDIFLTTKIWPDRLKAEMIAPALDESLERLGVEQIDLLLIHWPNPQVPVAETLHAMAAERQAGRVRFVGVSNFNTALLREALATGVPLLCNQVEFHPFLDQSRILEATRAAGLHLIAYSPLARGGVNQSDVLRFIAARLGRTPAQVALRWLIQHDGVGYVAKASSRARIAENLDVFSFDLTQEDIAAIDGLADGKRVVNLSIAPTWD
jgi:diketogulonate reductase-like aldo/keto reductase